MDFIVERIIRLSKKHKITGSELGHLLGLKKSPLTDWKNKKSSPTLEQLVKICEIFAINSDYLLFGKLPALSSDQQELLTNYSKLDSRGQHRVHIVIYEELDRIEHAIASEKSIV